MKKELLYLAVVVFAVGCASTGKEIADIPIYDDGMTVEERRASGDEKGAALQALLNKERHERKQLEIRQRQIRFRQLQADLSRINRETNRRIYGR